VETTRFRRTLTRGALVALLAAGGRWAAVSQQAQKDQQAQESASVLASAEAMNRTVQAAVPRRPTTTEQQLPKIGDCIRQKTTSHYVSVKCSQPHSGKVLKRLTKAQGEDGYFKGLFPLPSLALPTYPGEPPTSTTIAEPLRTWLTDCGAGTDAVLRVDHTSSDPADIIVFCVNTNQ
jgi:hypothetical protein